MTEPVRRPAPSWFPESSEDFAAPVHRPVMPREETMARQRYYRQFPHEADEMANLSRRRSLAGVYAMAGLLAIFAGGATGMVFAHLDGLFQGARPPVTIAAARGGGETVIAKKLVPTATLNVADARGPANSKIPLMLSAEPALGGADIALRISGLPKEAYLTAGSKTADETWLLQLEEAAKVNLVVPRADQTSYDLSVAAVETGSGELAAPVKEMNVAINDPALTITPVSADPESKPAAQPVSNAVLGLLKKGDMLLSSGDMAAARQFYGQAFALGANEGATGVAKTYDPAVYRQLNVQGLAPDEALAREWYRKAAH